MNSEQLVHAHAKGNALSCSSESLHPKNLASIFGSSLSQRVRDCTLLVVGSGGIGCELLKDLVLTGFGNIHIVDLDTIEVSNLNRQFLFRREHVGRSKALVATEAVLALGPRILPASTSSACHITQSTVGDLQSSIGNGGQSSSNQTVFEMGYSSHVTAYHDSIMSNRFDVAFFEQFDLVLNALDNQAARKHVNRMCLAARRCLVESGSAGYLGQVDVMCAPLFSNAPRSEDAPTRSECYECTPKPVAKTYPACTIRNTPTEPVHCIVWAKYLFNQLFGEEDPDQDVAPDSNDPELTSSTNAQKSSLNPSSEQRPHFSTRKWAEYVEYNPTKLINKLFVDDINYLLSMANLWKSRRAPEPVALENALGILRSLFIETSLSDSELILRVEHTLASATTHSLPLPSPSSCSLHSTPSPAAASGATAKVEAELYSEKHASWLHRPWSPEQCLLEWARALRTLYALTLTPPSTHTEHAQGGPVRKTLVWDKDEDACMAFVAAAANLRMRCFHIEPTSYWECKSIAGNIIPAIASTNAIVAGLIVLEALKLLAQNYKESRSVYIQRKPTLTKGAILVSSMPQPANPKCFVCAESATARLTINFDTFTLRQLHDKVLKGALNFLAPDVIDSARGTVLISSDPDDVNILIDNKLRDCGLNSGTALKCDDFFQQYSLSLILIHSDKLGANKSREEKTSEFELESASTQSHSQSQLSMHEKQDGNGHSSSVTTSGQLTSLPSEDTHLALNGTSLELERQMQASHDVETLEGSRSRKRAHDGSHEHEHIGQEQMSFGKMTRLEATDKKDDDVL